MKKESILQFTFQNKSIASSFIVGWTLAKLFYGGKEYIKEFTKRYLSGKRKKETKS